MISNVPLYRSCGSMTPRCCCRGRGRLPGRYRRDLLPSKRLDFLNEFPTLMQSFNVVASTNTLSIYKNVGYRAPARTIMKRTL